ncbi:mismatch-specific DNA-glycosylase [Aspergillus stella-maris]|uniref:mismatch-specific DNA-glycosylase n=1 Tax=Aspergillus stella-maris TaxID=1810926 RepID=UPI003CCCB5DA
MAKSPFFAEAPIKEMDTAFLPSDETVPVDQIRSFNGVLNKYVHVSETTTANTSSRSPSHETKRQLETTTTTIETQTTPKRRKPTRLTTSPPQTTTPGRITRSQSIKSRSTTPASPPAHPSRSPLRSGTPQTPRSRSRSAPRRQTSSPSSLPTSLLRDTIPQNLTLLLVGVNPGIATGQTGFAYAHPSNLFWKLLHWSGITPIRHPPSDTYKLPELYNIGNTNIVERATRDASMLSKAEMDAGVPVLEKKVAANKPGVVCLVGKSIWEAVWRARKGKAIKKEEFRYGWQDEGENMGVSEEWEGAKVFVATTTSGLAAGMSLAEKRAVWDELGAWVVPRREAWMRAKAGAVAVPQTEDGAPSNT